MSHVFGYTIANDVTARDIQKKHNQWFKGKTLDRTCPMGPCIVLAEDLDASDLKISLWLNGDKKQDSRTSKMIFDIPAIIGGSYLMLPIMIIKITMVITIWPFDNRIHYSSYFLCSPYSSHSSYSSDSSYFLASLLSPYSAYPFYFSQRVSQRVSPSTLETSFWPARPMVSDSLPSPLAPSCRVTMSG